MLRRRSRKIKQKNDMVQKKMVQKQVKTKYFASFFKKRKNKKKDITQRNITLLGGPTNNKHRQFKKNIAFFVKKGQYVKGEKREKNDVQTKQSFQKKRYQKRDQQRTTFKNENKLE